VQLNGGGWQAAAKGMRLKPGDRIHTGWKGRAVLDVRGQAVAIEPMTMIVISANADGTTGYLKFGEVKVKPAARRPT
jgi:hypothetical protein